MIKKTFYDATNMAYYDSMVLADYTGLQIELSDEVWESHIQQSHPEISKEQIKNTLLNPDEVWESKHRTDVELYYKVKEDSAPDKVRHVVVVVKKIATGNFVSTAYTKDNIVGAKQVYKKP